MFVEVIFTDERHRAERLSDALLEAGALSASIEDADAGNADEQAIYGEPGSETGERSWNRSRIVALFDARANVEAAIDEALHIAGIDEVLPVQRREVADADWVRLTQSQFEPIRIGRRLWIVPSWHATPADATRDDAIVVRLDPGLAFGTGDHPTTRLCLAWLDQALVRGAGVLDYGCGSGILAIAAKRLGAGTVTGTDIDDQAIAAARTNARDNDVDIEFVPSRSFAGQPVDIVVANILSNPLKLLAPSLSNLVLPGGQLVLSGILDRQWQEVAATYAPMLRLQRWREEDGWVCLVATRPGV